MNSKCRPVRTLNGRILQDWTQSRSSNNVLYYINHKHMITQWDHPEYVKLMDEIVPINTVKYAAYRTACKLRQLQTRVKFHEVTLSCLASSFDAAGLKVAENSDIVSVKEIEKVIAYILRTTYKHSGVDTNVCKDLIINMILNAYDEQRTGNLQVLKCKIFLLTLCKGRLQEKYKYLFGQIADHNNCCTRRRLARLLQDLASVTELVSEQLNFGISLVASAVESCFKDIDSFDVGVTEEHFLNWLLKEPQTLVWWTTLYRLSAAELVCHDVKCNICKQRPIIGLRYQCLRCIDYNQCQDCFLHGRFNKSHKLSHPIQEYCHESTTKEWRKSLFKILRHRIKKSSPYKPRFLSLPENDPKASIGSLLESTNSGSYFNAAPCPSKQERVFDDLIENEDSEGEEELLSRTICHSRDDLDQLDRPSSSSKDSKTTKEDIVGEPLILPTTPRHQIHSVILHLQEGQKDLWDQMESANTPAKKVPSQYVERHMLELQTQINKLKLILQNYSPNSTINKRNRQSKNGFPRMESTPIVGERGLHLSLSPIGLDSHQNDSAELDNKENHRTETVVNKKVVLTTRQSFSGCNTTDDRKVLTSLSDRSNSLRVGSARTNRVRNLPNFTNLSFSDLTESSAIVSPRLSKPIEGQQISNNNIQKEITEEWKQLDGLNKDESSIVQLKAELDVLLDHLQGMFLSGNKMVDDNTGSKLPKKVLNAAYEIGDALENYVDQVPNAEEQTTL